MSKLDAILLQFEEEKKKVEKEEKDKSEKEMAEKKAKEDEEYEKKFSEKFTHHFSEHAKGYDDRLKNCEDGIGKITSMMEKMSAK